MKYDGDDENRGKLPRAYFTPHLVACTYLVKYYIGTYPAGFVHSSVNKYSVDYDIFFPRREKGFVSPLELRILHLPIVRNTHK